LPIQLAKPLYNLVLSMNTNPVRYLASHRQSSKLPMQLAKPLHNLGMSMNTKPVRYLVSHRQSSKLPMQLAKPLYNLVMSMNTNPVRYLVSHTDRAQSSSLFLTGLRIRIKVKIQMLQRLKIGPWRDIVGEHLSGDAGARASLSDETS
jgi:hypothetical protein